MSESDPGLHLLKLVAGNLLEWHPFYVYSRITTPDTRVPSFVPFLHQLELAVDYSYRRVIRVLIGDEIGLGKTVEAIIALRTLEKRIFENEGREPRFLVIVPRVLVDQWQGELARAGISKIRTILSKYDVERLESSSPISGGYYIASLQLVRRSEHSQVLARISWDAVVVDEAHNIGFVNTPTRSYKLVHALTRNPNTSVILLSATPHRGKSDDYLARLMLLIPGLDIDTIREKVRDSSNLDNRKFYEKTHYTLLYRRGKEYVNALEGREVFKEAHLTALLVRIDPDEKRFENLLLTFMRRKLREIGPYIWEDGRPEGLLLSLLLKRASSSIYAALRTLVSILDTLHGAHQVEHGGEAGIDAIATSTLDLSYEEYEGLEPDDLIERLVSSRLVYEHLLSSRDIEDLEDLQSLASKIVNKGEAKLKALCELIKTIIHEKHYKIVVFTEYKDTLHYLVNRLPSCLEGVRLDCISGAQEGPCRRERVEEVKEKLNSGEIDIILATDVASEGLNLQRANVLINYDVPWSPVKLEQRIGRVWRIGQDKEVFVYNFFKDSRIDLNIVDKLYLKILNIERATGSSATTAKSPLGERLMQFVYAEGTIQDISEMYRPRGAISSAIYDITSRPFEEEVARRLLESPSSLEDLARLIIERIYSLNEELAEKHVYPSERREWIRAKKVNLLKQLMGDPRDDSSDIEVNDYFIKQVIALKTILDRTSPFPMNILMNRIDLAVKELLKIKLSLSKIQPISAKTPLILESSMLKKPIIIMSVTLKKNQEVVHKEVTGVDYNQGKAHRLAGPALLDKIIEIINNSKLKARENYPRDVLGKYVTSSKMRVQLMFGSSGSLYNRVKTRVEGLREEIKRSLGLQEELERQLIEAFDTTEYTINIEPLIILVPPSPAPRHGGGTGREFSEERLAIESEAIRGIIRYYEEINNRRILDIHELMLPFDLLSIEKSTNKIVRIIEVKSHAMINYEVVFSENEYRLGMYLKDLYWLYLAVNVRGRKPCLLVVRDPITRLNLQRAEADGKAVYRAEVNPESANIDDTFCLDRL